MDPFPRLRNDENKMTYQNRPGSDLTTKMPFFPIDKFLISEVGLLKKVSQLNF